MFLFDGLANEVIVTTYVGIIIIINFTSWALECT